MAGFFRRLFTSAEPSRPRVEARLTELENHFDDIDSRLDYLTSELKKVRGRQFSLEKHRDDDPGTTIDERASLEHMPVPPSPRSPFSSAHLSRRFKGS